MDPNSFDLLCEQLASLHAGPAERSGDEHRQEWRRCLYLKILSSTNYPLKTLSSILSNLWKTKNLFQISSETNGIFKVLFSTTADLENVLARTPWKIKTSDLIILERLIPDKPLLSYKFDRAEFWIQLHGIPANRLNLDFVYTTASKIGIVCPIPEGLDKEWASFARVKVAVNIYEQLPRSITADLANGASCHVQLKYERLPKLCRFCGFLGHSTASCGKLAEGNKILDTAVLSSFQRSELSRRLAFRFDDSIRAEHNNPYTRVSSTHRRAGEHSEEPVPHQEGTITANSVKPGGKEGTKPTTLVPSAGGGIRGQNEVYDSPLSPGPTQRQLTHPHYQTNSMQTTPNYHFHIGGLPSSLSFSTSPLPNFRSDTFQKPYSLNITPCPIPNNGESIIDFSTNLAPTILNLEDMDTSTPLSATYPLLFPLRSSSVNSSQAPSSQQDNSPPLAFTIPPTTSRLPPRSGSANPPHSATGKRPLALIEDEGMTIPKSAKRPRSCTILLSTEKRVVAAGPTQPQSQC